MSVDLNRQQIGMEIVNCDKGVQHSGERIEYICLDMNCRKNRLCCKVCKHLFHKGHEFMPLEGLIDQVDRKVFLERRKINLSLLRELENRKEQSATALNNIKEFAIDKFEKIGRKADNYFDKMKCDVEERRKFEMQQHSIRNEKKRDALEAQTQEILDKSIIKDRRLTSYFEGEGFNPKISRYLEDLNEFVESLFDSIRKMQASISQSYSKISFQLPKEDNDDNDKEMKVLIPSIMQQTNSVSSYLPDKSDSKSAAERHQTISSNHKINNSCSNNDLNIDTQLRSEQQLIRNKQNQFLSPTSSSNGISINQIPKEQLNEMSRLSHKHIAMIKQISDQQALIGQLAMQHTKQMNQSASQPTQFLKSSNPKQPLNTEESKVLPNNNNNSHTNQTPSPSRLYYSSLFKYHNQNKSTTNASSPYGIFWKPPSQDKQNGSRTPSPIPQNRNLDSQHKSVNESQVMEKKSRLWEQDANQNIDDPDFENTKIAQIPKSSERQFKIKFDKFLKHSSILIVDNSQFLTVKGALDCTRARIAIATPSLQTMPLREFRWSIQILNCQSIAYSNPLAVGICLRKHVEISQFDFNGEDTASIKRSKSDEDDRSTHGCYLLTAAGYIRNHTDSNQDMKSVNVRFGKGDTLSCHYNPFRKYLKIKNNSSGQLCMINISLNPTDSLHPCARISYCMDMVQIRDEN